MFGIIRIGAYLVSGLTVWQFFQGDISSAGLTRHMVLDPSRGMLVGVCAGLSDFTGIDVTLIRLGWFLLALYRGVGIILYILAFLIMPISG